jgi:septal ring factor EnvC (AmiA/AmiB activator)
MTDLEDVRVVVTMKQAVAGGVAFACCAWAVLTFTIGGMRDDVSSIRTALEATQASGAQNSDKDRETEVGLRNELGELTAQLRETTATLSALADSVSGLNGSIQSVDQKLTESIFRQQDFERWVVTRLGTPGQQPTVLPAWEAQQIDVIKAVSEGPSEPLGEWYSAIQGRN